MRGCVSTVAGRVVRLADRRDLVADRGLGLDLGHRTAFLVRTSGSAAVTVGPCPESATESARRYRASAQRNALRHWPDGRQLLPPRRQRHQPGAGAARRVRRPTTGGSPSPSSRSGPGCRCRRRTGWSASWSAWGALTRTRTGEYVDRPAAVGPRAARAGADRAARAGLALPPRPVRRDAGHRAPRGPRRHRGALPRPAARATRRCRSSARSAPGCRCTRPGSARCCSPTPRPTCRRRCWRELTRVTPYTITQPGLLPPPARAGAAATTTPPRSRR